MVARARNGNVIDSVAGNRFGRKTNYYHVAL